MTAQSTIDELYVAFAETLPGGLVAPAMGLAVTLGLAPSRDVPWSEVFSHEITLAAPLLVAEAMPAIPTPVVRDATLAHMLAVIEAFGTDRVEDGQVEATSELAALLQRARLARDAALARVLAASPGGGAGFAAAEEDTLAAIRAEQAMLRSGEGVSFERYLAISHGKQRVGLPASLALAAVAGWDARRTRSLARLLDAVWVGLQLHDDVIDWEDDLARGGAWAASLGAYAPPREGSHERATVPVSMTGLVQASGVLGRMLSASARRFGAARRRAEILGARRLAAWAQQREATMRELARSEAESPGFANRAHALSAWAKTVLR